FGFDSLWRDAYFMLAEFRPLCSRVVTELVTSIRIGKRIRFPAAICRGERHHRIRQRLAVQRDCASDITQLWTLITATADQQGREDCHKSGKTKKRATVKQH